MKRTGVSVYVCVFEFLWISWMDGCGKVRKEKKEGKERAIQVDAGKVTEWGMHRAWLVEGGAPTPLPLEWFGWEMHTTLWGIGLITSTLTCPLVNILQG